MKLWPINVLFFKRQIYFYSSKKASRRNMPKRLLWAERSDGWRCPPNAPKKRWKDQVAADVSTHLTRRLYRDPLQGDMTGVVVWYDVCLHCRATAERGAWRGLRYDILASSDVVVILASTHFQMPWVSMVKRRSDLTNKFTCPPNHSHDNASRL